MVWLTLDNQVTQEVWSTLTEWNTITLNWVPSSLLFHSLCVSTHRPFASSSQDRKEEEDMTGHQDFQGHVDKTVRMDVPEKEGIRGPEYVQFCCRISLSHMFIQASQVCRRDKALLCFYPKTWRLAKSIWVLYHKDVRSQFHRKKPLLSLSFVCGATTSLLMLYLLLVVLHSSS